MIPALVKPVKAPSCIVAAAVSELCYWLVELLSPRPTDGTSVCFCLPVTCWRQSKAITIVLKKYYKVNTPKVNIKVFPFWSFKDIGTHTRCERVR